MRTLFLDIETAPNLGYTWAKWEQNVIGFQRERYMLCFSYKWAHEKKVHVVSQIDYANDFAKDPFDDTALLMALWPLLNEADVIIGHNVVKFDLKMINAFFVLKGIAPPSPYQTIDTLLIARRYFAFNSNSLGDLLEALELGEKLSTGGFGLWTGCMRGDAASWRKMIRYSRRDTDRLPPLYERLRPFMRNHPTMNHGNPEACPVCNEAGHLKKDGIRYTKTGQYQGYWCAACGSYPSDRTLNKQAVKPERVHR